MCLGTPGRIESIDDLEATVVWRGVVSKALLHVVGEEVGLGDWVLVSRGWVLRRIDPEDLDETLAMYDRLLEDSPPGAI